MILRDNSKIISDTFNKFLVNTGNTLKIDKDTRFLVETDDAFDPV